MDRGERGAHEDGTEAREVWGQNQKEQIDQNKIRIDVSSTTVDRIVA